mmetsp:Transcript_97832/g.276752  ORF Transcript_97832/g.276752 Transcript_97832/m.276752 type:complete len:355 (+) Transcript_97832:61-1125(+)
MQAPQGLSYGVVDDQLTSRALADARNIFDTYSLKKNAGCDTVEFGWDCHGYCENKPTWHQGECPSQCPALCAFMDAAMGMLCPEGRRLLDETGSGLRRVNIAVRRCRAGQRIQPHTDRSWYEEPVWAAVLFRTESCPVLRYERHKPPGAFDVQERCGAVHRIVGDARWRWRHGLQKLGSEDERISVSWRWFRADHTMLWENGVTSCPVGNEDAIVARVLKSLQAHASAQGELGAQEPPELPRLGALIVASFDCAAHGDENLNSGSVRSWSLNCCGISTMPGLTVSRSPWLKVGSRLSLSLCLASAVLVPIAMGPDMMRLASPSLNGIGSICRLLWAMGYRMGGSMFTSFPRPMG